MRAARAAGDLELVLLAQRSRVASHLELGDIATADRELRACEHTANVLRTPNARWQHTVLRAMRALVGGDLEAAERDVHLAIQLGERLDESYVSFQLPLQLAYLRLEQGRAAEIEPGAREQVAVSRECWPGTRVSRASSSLQAGLRRRGRSSNCCRTRASRTVPATAAG